MKIPFIKSSLEIMGNVDGCTNGSIRFPAFFNGVFGHKPTGGLVPGTGQYPFKTNEALRYLTTGVLARSADDLMPLLNIIAGPDGQDAGCKPFDLGDPLDARMGDLNIINVDSNGVAPVRADLFQAQRKCADHLERMGARVNKLTIRNLKYSFNIWSSMLSMVEGPSLGLLLGNGQPIHKIRELAKCCIGSSVHTLPALILATLENIPKLTPSRTRRFVEMGYQLEKELMDLIGPNGVMLYPSYTNPLYGIPKSAKGVHAQESSLC